MSEHIDEILSWMLEGDDPEEVLAILDEAKPWRKKTASQLMRTRRLRRRRKHRRVDPKRSRVMKKAMRKFGRQKSKVRQAARRRSKY